MILVLLKPEEATWQSCFSIMKDTEKNPDLILMNTRIQSESSSDHMEFSHHGISPARTVLEKKPPHNDYKVLAGLLGY